MSDIDKTQLLDMTTKVVTAYLTNNTIGAEEVSEFIETVYTSLETIAYRDINIDDGPPPEPAVPVLESVTDDFIICLEDGQSFQSLKRHLRVKYNMTPETYRKKWHLPPDYPMVAPNYAKRRSALAKKTGLGKNR